MGGAVKYGRGIAIDTETAMIPTKTKRQMVTQSLFAPIHTQTDCDAASDPYLQELRVEIVEAPQKIQFTSNAEAPIHRWAPYIQGFSASFVLSKLNQYIRQLNGCLRAHDPFAGCGTVLVEAKKTGVWSSTGTELNPLLSYITGVKLNCWDVDPDALWLQYEKLRFGDLAPFPEFLDTERQFKPAVLENLQRILATVQKVRSPKIRDLLRVAFSGILTDCSNLKRTPSLGYDKSKNVHHTAPLKLFQQKVEQMCEDLRLIRRAFSQAISNPAEIFTENAKAFSPKPISVAITSPPYMNGLDYVMNYKIEMAWLGFLGGYKTGKALKDSMVACDNISKGLTKTFASMPDKYREPWLDAILETLRENVANWGPEHKRKRIQRTRSGPPSDGYRRPDMPEIVHKYFDDMDKVMAKISASLAPNGRFILVLGDSFIADTYIPTDLLIAKMGTLRGLEIESIERARNRRSGQIRSFKLRETIVTLRKPQQV